MMMMEPLYLYGLLWLFLRLAVVVSYFAPSQGSEANNLTESSFSTQSIIYLEVFLLNKLFILPVMTSLCSSKVQLQWLLRELHTSIKGGHILHIVLYLYISDGRNT